ncbi:hypothetical protein AX767_17740 [Variovorax sp. PAMC 28711]|nr:hypothetical protein AX767_17740 [Variovorax sp. PAMC 28711]
MPHRQAAPRAAQFFSRWRGAGDNKGTLMNDFNKSPEQLVDDAADTGRAYAKDAVNATGKKIDSVKSQLSQTTDALTKAIHDEPVKAVLITAVVSSVLTALVIAAIRGEDHYF